MTAEQQAKVWEAVCEYSLNFNLIELDGVCDVAFTLIKPQLDANNKRFKNGKKGAKFGVKGGNPKLTPKQPQVNPKSTPNANVNVNVNVNPNDNKNLNKVPTLPEFLTYAEESLRERYHKLKYSLELKYQSWVENNWKDGNGSPIRNWKSKILNVAPYLKESEPFKKFSLPNDFSV